MSAFFAVRAEDGVVEGLRGRFGGAVWCECVAAGGAARGEGLGGEGWGGVVGGDFLADLVLRVRGLVWSIG